MIVRVYGSGGVRSRSSRRSVLVSTHFRSVYWEMDKVFDSHVLIVVLSPSHHQYIIFLKQDHQYIMDGDFYRVDQVQVDEMNYVYTSLY